MKSFGLFVQFFILFIVSMGLLQASGCLPQSKPDPNYVPSDEYRMKEIERKWKMLENNQNW